MHWSGGSIGYFPTYALGNLISAQIWERVTAELPDLDDAFEPGEFGPLRDWLRENLHRHGRKFTPAETLERVVGSPRSIRSRTCATSARSSRRIYGHRRA